MKLLLDLEDSTITDLFTNKELSSSRAIAVIEHLSGIVHTRYTKIIAEDAEAERLGKKRSQPAEMPADAAAPQIGDGGSAEGFTNEALGLDQKEHELCLVG